VTLILKVGAGFSCAAETSGMTRRTMKTATALLFMARIELAGIIKQIPIQEKAGIMARNCR
jgi:hypothetical protein